MPDTTREEGDELKSKVQYTKWNAHLKSRYGWRCCCHLLFQCCSEPSIKTRCALRSHTRLPFCLCTAIKVDDNRVDITRTSAVRLVAGRLR